MPAGRDELLSWHCRLQRCPVGSALDHEATVLTGEKLRNVGDSLIGAARHLLLTAGDTRCGPIGAARHRLLTGGNANLVVLPHCVEVERHRVELLGRGTNDRRDDIRRVRVQRN